ncbi:MAG: hypothetical protein ACHQCH_02360 [Solirubrobacterales bacterium]
MSSTRRTAILALLLTAAVALLSGSGSFTAGAGAQGLADDGGAEWRLEAVKPPQLPGESQKEHEGRTPVGLGKVGDIQFWAPNRGLLITAGNGSTIPPGLWAYNGQGWHELSIVCGATDGRIAWAGPDEFWTVSDGRPGQAIDAEGRPPPLEDDTLCHFSGGKVVTSYASLAFQASSYQPMHAAGCIGSSDCWFAGDPLPPPLTGAFQLHWNGSSVTAEPNPQGHAVEDMRPFEGGLYESLRISPEDLLTTKELEPAVLHLINPEGTQPPFVTVPPEVPLYGPEEFASALGFLHLSADEEALWGAANPVREEELPAGSEHGQVTVVRYAAGSWSQALGTNTDPEGKNPFTKFIPAVEPTQEEREKAEQNDVVSSIAAEPGGENAWMTLDTQAGSEQPSPSAPARIARISAAGTVSAEDRLQLPSAGETAEGIGPKGAASKITCPAPHDCWMVSTQGWLFHLAPAGERTLPENGDEAFTGLITVRPKDEGLPQELPDAPPPDDSGLPGERPGGTGSLLETAGPAPEPGVTAPLLSHLHSRVVHGNTLELSFHLAVKARIRLIAKRRKSVVASTPMRTLAAGNRKLLLRLDRRRWPTKLDLQTHALAKLPIVSTRGAGNTTVETGLRVLPHTPSFAQAGLPH